MTTPTVALLTIGQAPRPDLAVELEQVLGARARLVQAGALDGLSAEEVARDFAPRDGSAPLITRLIDGSTAVADAAAVFRRLQETVTRVEQQDADVVVVMCTGRFPQLRSERAWLIEPDAVVPATVSALLGDRRLGIIVPLPEQEAESVAKWKLSPRPLSTAASPYGPMEPLVEQGRRLQDEGADALVLDCMGFTDEHRQALVDAGVQVPVFVSNRVLASAVSAMI